MTRNLEKENFFAFILQDNAIGQTYKTKMWQILTNWRDTSEDVFLRGKLTDYLILFVEYLNLYPNYSYGVLEGASKFGIITQYNWAKTQENYNSGSYDLSMGVENQKSTGIKKIKTFFHLKM